MTTQELYDRDIERIANGESTMGPPILTPIGKRQLDAFPDLLAACKAWIAEAKAGLASGMNSEVIEQTVAAIARAEGRQ